MFERYTEPARRTIFLGRYEAHRLGSNHIEPEHLLLALLRGEKRLASELSEGAVEAIRKRIEGTQSSSLSATSSVDLPLSHASKRVLAYGAEEAERKNHKLIDSGHLVLGLLREQCLAAELLGEHGIDIERYRAVVGASVSREDTRGVQTLVTPTRRPAAWHELPPVEPAATSLKPTIERLGNLVSTTFDSVRQQSVVYAEQRLKRKPWTRKEAFGHLIDWAAAHQQWFARALTEPKVLAPAYPSDEWVAAQRYGEFTWKETLDLWILSNRLLIHVLAQIPGEKLKTPCRIGIEEPIPLSELIARYVAHCGEIVGQILAHL